MAADSPPNASVNWTAHLKPHLSTALRDTNEALSRVPAVQKWVRTTASEIAAERQPAAMQNQMHGYSAARNALHKAFPDLQSTIAELTDGLGTLDLEWRPFSPHLTQIRVTFDRDYEVDVFMRIDAPTRSALNEHLDALQSQLPDSEPFPRRSHTRTALWSHTGDGVGVRIHQHHPDDDVHRYRFALLPKNEAPDTDLNREALVTTLLNRWT